MDLKNYFNVLKEGNSNFKKTKIITYQDMLKVPTGKEMTYNDEGTITGTRIHYTPDGVSFRMFMPKGTIFVEHEHDCIETIVVYQGLLKDKTKKVGRMQSISFPAFTKHTVEALEDSIFYVEFKKPK